MGYSVNDFIDEIKQITLEDVVKSVNIFSDDNMCEVALSLYNNDELQVYYDIGLSDDNHLIYKDDNGLIYKDTSNTWYEGIIHVKNYYEGVQDEEQYSAFCFGITKNGEIIKELHIKDGKPDNSHHEEYTQKDFEEQLLEGIDYMKYDLEGRTLENLRCERNVELINNMKSSIKIEKEKISR